MNTKNIKRDLLKIRNEIISELIFNGIRGIEIINANVGDIIPQNDQWILYVKGRHTQPIILRKGLGEQISVFLTLRKELGEIFNKTTPLIISRGYAASMGRLSVSGFERIIEKIH